MRNLLSFDSHNSGVPSVIVIIYSLLSLKIFSSMSNLSWSAVCQYTITKLQLCKRGATPLTRPCSYGISFKSLVIQCVLPPLNLQRSLQKARLINLVWRITYFCVEISLTCFLSVQDFGYFSLTRKIAGSLSYHRWLTDSRYETSMTQLNKKDPAFRIVLTRLFLWIITLNSP